MGAIHELPLRAACCVIALLRVGAIYELPRPECAMSVADVLDRRIRKGNKTAGWCCTRRPA